MNDASLSDPAPVAAPVREPSGWRVALWLLLIAAGFAGLFLLGYLPRTAQQAALAAETARVALEAPKVRVALPRLAPGTVAVSLPGTVEAMRTATIYARSSGYVRRWHADLGDQVTEGQLLAELDAPERAQELAQAEATVAETRANLEQTRANLALARLNLERAKALGPAVASQQTIDTRQAEHDAISASQGAWEARVRAEEANVRRLQQLKSFSQVFAPFAGTITRRAIEVGDLVTAGSGSGSLFVLAQTDRLRVLIDVPQTLASAISIGLEAQVAPRATASASAATATGTGQVRHLARALDQGTRTMRVEVSVPATAGLLPGMYAQVALSLPNARPLLMFSANALVLTGKGARVATVGGDGRIRFKEVTVELDTGAELGVSAGIDATDRIVINPAGRLEDGLAVEIVPEAAPAAPKPNAK
jgi:RND family efflux transporter MFP subunit